MERAHVLTNHLAQRQFATICRTRARIPGLTMLEADYLVIGAGAMAMAFVDTLLTETQATILMVDRQPSPGGHWNNAYPFVRLHQPSMSYGVNSYKLGDDAKDQTGWNKGLYELASGPEIMAYYDRVMQRRFLPSGRVQYFPMCEYSKDGRFKSLITGQAYEVAIHKKIVDATYARVEVPRDRVPPYRVTGTQCVPPNELGRIKGAHAGYVVIGGGKTAMDTCLWLLQNSVDPDTITWIRSRESYLFNRANTQGGSFARQSSLRYMDFVGIMAQARTIQEVFRKWVHGEHWLQIDETATPQMFHGATVSPVELRQLRRIKNVIKMGHVLAVESDRIVLEGGSIPTTRDHLHVDCTARGGRKRPVAAIFSKKRITLQTVRMFQPVFSSALIAKVEALFQEEDDERKAAVCGAVVQTPDTPVDYLEYSMTHFANQARWFKNKDLRKWFKTARLYGGATAGYKGVLSAAESKLMISNLTKAAVNLSRLLSQSKTHRREHIMAED